MKQRGIFRDRQWFGLLCGAGLLVGCTVPIAVGLDESDANHAVVALESRGRGSAGAFLAAIR